VPERDVLEGNHRVGAHDAREAAEVLGKNRIALVRHGRRAFLALAERLERLEQLGALEMAYLCRESLDASGNDGERREKRRVAVARHDLRRDGLGKKVELLEHFGLDVGAVDAVASDRAGKLAERDLAPGLLEPRTGPGKLGVPAGELESERDRLRVNAVASPDHDGLAMRLGLLANGSLQPFERFRKDPRGFDELERKRGVDDVGRGHAEVQETSCVTDGLSNSGHEGN